jgi:hypothetical protein
MPVGSVKVGKGEYNAGKSEAVIDERIVDYIFGVIEVDEAILGCSQENGQGNDRQGDGNAYHPPIKKIIDRRLAIRHWMHSF